MSQQVEPTAIGTDPKCGHIVAAIMAPRGKRDLATMAEWVVRGLTVRVVDSMEGMDWCLSACPRRAERKAALDAK
jgi:hypothetical protein